MSSGIWTRCGGKTNFRKIDGTVWRVTESQQRISTRQLVDTDAEHELIEALIEDSKPAVPDGPEFAVHFLLFSPFRYPPLPHGSRFGTRLERAMWYGSDLLETALAEAAYYHLVFLEGTAAKLVPNRVVKSAVPVAVRSEASVDLSLPPFDAYRTVLCSKSEYGETQRLGSEMRVAGVEMLRYVSARDPKQGTNMGLFTPAAFAVGKPVGSPQTWYCTATPTAISWSYEDIGGLIKHEFARSLFLVDGKLPTPAF